MTDSSAIELAMIASGSGGNAAFVRVGQTRLLIDAGVSCRRLSAALTGYGESWGRIDAILLTHEHGDHIKALERLRLTHPEIPIYATNRVAFCLRKKWGFLKLQSMTPRRPFSLGDARITPLPVEHDAQDPVCFRIDHGELSLGYATDLGVATADVEHALYDAQLVVIEANHCREMLRRGPYPRRLKQRVASRRGHLSNAQTRALLESIVSDSLQHVVLAHLSKKNNSPERALEVISPAVDGLGVTIHVAEQSTPGSLIRVTNPYRETIISPKVTLPSQRALPF